MTTKPGDTTAIPTIYNIEVPPIKQWDKERGEWLEPKYYSTPAWVKYHEKLIILDGKAVTEDITIALELVDMGANVSPDPRPLWQENHAARLKEDADEDPKRLYELSKYVNETNAWRQARGLKPLSIEAPKVGRPTSALVSGMQ